MNGESTSMVWPTLGSRTAQTEQNRTIYEHCLRRSYSYASESYRLAWIWNEIRSLSPNVFNVRVAAVAVTDASVPSARTTETTCCRPAARQLHCPPVRPATETHTHTHPFNGPFSGTTQVSRYQKGKTNLDFTEARDGEWQWHQLGRMKVGTSLQTDNHASTPSLSFLQAGSMPFLPPNQRCQSTEGMF